jgi:aspartyl-tRNA(Asn)/glutamyl-tRNA(Gln) amidotransferase subunit B
VYPTDKKRCIQNAGGKEKAFGYLVGQSMKELRGKADPALVNSILKKLLG